MGDRNFQVSVTYLYRIEILKHDDSPARCRRSQKGRNHAEGVSSEGKGVQYRTEVVQPPS